MCRHSRCLWITGAGWTPALIYYEPPTIQRIALISAYIAIAQRVAPRQRTRKSHRNKPHISFASCLTYSAPSEHPCARRWRVHSVICMTYDAYIRLAPLSAMSDISDELRLAGELLDAIAGDAGPWEARRLVEQAASEVYELAFQLEAVRDVLARR